jgi:Tfp pilus assembly protein PilX
MKWFTRVPYAKRAFRRTSRDQAGFSIPMLLSVIIAFSLFGTALLMVILNNFFVVGNNIKSQQAFNVAEAGINYYLWHLSHNSTDFKDGKTTPATPDATLGYGPYVHNYVDDNAKTTGTYTLWIKPQGNGSTIATVRSIGKINGSSTIRTVQAQIGASSFASYGVVSDTALWFGSNETADGPVFSNQGVRMDGQNTAEVYSANASYVPPDSLGGDGTASHPGVWCDTSVTAPINCSTRTKVDWIYPTSAIDFNQVSGSLCTIKKVAFAADAATSSLAAQANACTQTPTTRTAAYLPQRSSSANSSRGYLIQLNTNGTYDLFNVNNEDDTKTTYTAALVSQSVATGITIPSSGVIFAEDNVWVRSNPTYHGRVTIAAGRLATNNVADIHIADDLVYSTKNGSDAIGLVAENDVLISPYAAPATGNFTLEVNAAVLAQAGNVQYPSNYSFANTTCARGWVDTNQKLYFYGSVASRQSWTWSWQRSGACGDSVKDPVSGYYISGFLHNTTQYDYNLRYAPPPSYPITGGYGILSWREVLTKP